MNRQVFVDLKNELPPTTKEEKKIAVVLIMLVIYLFTQQIHKAAIAEVAPINIRKMIAITNTEKTIAI